MELNQRVVVLTEEYEPNQTRILFATCNVPVLFVCYFFHSVINLWSLIRLDLIIRFTISLSFACLLVLSLARWLAHHHHLLLLPFPNSHFINASIIFFSLETIRFPLFCSAFDSALIKPFLTFFNLLVFFSGLQWLYRSIHGHHYQMGTLIKH